MCDVGELNTTPAKALLAPSYFAINLRSVVVTAKIDQEAEAQYVGQTKIISASLNTSVCDAIHADEDEISWQKMIVQEKDRRGHDPQH